MTLNFTYAHSGASSAYVRTWGTQDWSFGTGTQYAVSPGQIFQLSAFVKLDMSYAWAGLRCLFRLRLCSMVPQLLQEMLS